MPVSNSIAKKRQAEELTRALGILAQDHVDYSHDHERYQSIITVVHAIINEQIYFNNLKSHGITCSRCLATIEKDLGSEIDTAALFIILNYANVDEKIFSKISLLNQAGEIGKASLLKQKINQTCYNLIKVQINDLIIDESYKALQKVGRQFLIKSSKHLIGLLQDGNITSQSLAYIKAAINSGFISADKIIKSCASDEAKQKIEKQIYTVQKFSKTA